MLTLKAGCARHCCIAHNIYVILHSKGQTAQRACVIAGCLGGIDSSGLCQDLHMHGSYQLHSYAWVVVPQKYAW